MQYVIDFTLEELKSHQKFKENHTEQQAEAIYEMLLDYENFTGVTASYLKNKGIVTKHYEYDKTPSSGWASIADDGYLVISLIKEE